MKPIQVKDATPIGTRRGGAFVDYSDGTGEFVVRDWPVYDRAFGDRIHAMKRARDLTLRQFANLLGLGVVDASGLEHGSKVPATEEDAAAILAALAGEDKP